MTYAQVNGLRLYYEVSGEGPPLVLLHGGGSTIETTFGRLRPLLASSHTLIAVELQAHGHTADRGTPTSFTQDADDVAALLETLHIARADILGFSNGGQTALQLAIRHPACVHHLVVASALTKRSGVAPGFWDGFADATLAQLPAPYADAFRAINPDPSALQTMFDRDAQRMLHFTDFPDADLATIAAPTLIVAADHDVPLPAHTAELAQLIPNARLLILPGMHGTYLGELMTAVSGSKQPEVFATLLDEFLAAT